jgi:hypothetical protein
MPSPFISYIMDNHLSESEVSVVFGSALRKLAEEFRNSIRGTNMLTNNFSKHLNKLHLLLQFPKVLQTFGDILSSENKSALQRSASELENNSVLGPYLRLSCITTPFQPGSFVYTSLLPNYPTTSREDFQMLQNNIRASLGQVSDQFYFSSD